MMQVAAEKVAWEASKKEGFELVTICPTFVLGPVISNRADATSILDVKVHQLGCLHHALHSLCRQLQACCALLSVVHLNNPCSLC